MQRHSSPADAARPPSVWLVCAAGALALAVAMGIGRFAFTPLLPLMQREGLLDLSGGAWLASANYLGYLLGALTAARLAARPRRLVLWCLFGTAATTAAVGLTQGLGPWLLLRAAAGVLSAWVLVGISSWSGGALAAAGRPHAGGWVFAGVGLGMAYAGGLAWAAGPAGPPALWLAMGASAALAAVLVQRLWPGRAPAARPAAVPDLPRPPAAVPAGSAGWVFCYGCFGFGYILPATYLPALARALVDDPRLFGLAWPAFGLAAAASALLAGHATRRWGAIPVWAGCQLVMALGCLLPLLSRSGWAIGGAALCVGGTFLVATMAGLQQARSLCPANPAPLLGRMTAAFALGQIAGPLLALALAHAPLGLGSGVEATLALAVVLLSATAYWLHRTSRRPATPPEARHPAASR